MFQKFFSKNFYIVGGCIRDFVVNRKITDIDLLGICSEEEFRLVLKKLSYKYNVFPLDEKRNVWRISIGKLTIDLSRNDDIKNDIFRRDFTINSLAARVDESNIKIYKDFFEIDLDKGKIIDITGKGLSDLKNGFIRHINSSIFDEDPLRIMRAIRFLSQFNFKILPETKKLIVSKKDLLNNVAKERIREELIKMALTDNFFASLNFMVSSGVLFVLFPEFEKQIKCAEIYYGKGGVLKHTLNVVEKLDIFFKKPQQYSLLPKKFYSKLYDEMYLIKIAGLFHDIAKPHTAIFKENRLRFFGHEEMGAEITEKILYDYKFSNKEIKYISTVIKNHLRIGSIACNDPITRRAVSRVFYCLKEYIFGLLVLSWADYASHIKNYRLRKIVDITKKSPFPLIKKLPPNGIKRTIRFLQVVNFIFKNYSRFYKYCEIKPLLDGNDIMNILSLSPGPQVGKIKNKLINLQIEGKIKSRKEAISYVKSLNKKSLF